MTWEQIQFKDFVKLQRGFDLPARLMQDGDIPVLGSNGIVGFHNEAKDSGPGVVTGRSGTLGLVQYTEGPYWPHNTSLWVKDFKENDPRFVYYKLKTLRLERFNGGVSVPTLNRNVLDTLRIKIPNKSRQKAISEFLTVYDELIKNNRRRIQLLEQAARLLYKEWFVHFRFPGHENVKIKDGIPEGWEKKPIKLLATLNYGKGLREADRADGNYPVYGSSGVVGFHDDALVKGKGIIIGRKGNVGSIFWSDEPFYPIDTVYYIKSEQSSFFIYFALKGMNFMNSDSAVPGLNREYAYKQKIKCPPTELLKHFEEIVKDIFNQRKTLLNYNNKLKEAQDLLLPRLMNGEIKV